MVAFISLFALCAIWLTLRSIYYDAVDGCSREMENEDQEMMVREYYLHDGWAAKHGTGA